MKQAEEQDSNRESVTDRINRKLAFVHSMAVAAAEFPDNFGELCPSVLSAYWYGLQETVEEIQGLIQQERATVQHGERHEAS